VTLHAHRGVDRTRERRADALAPFLVWTMFAAVGVAIFVTYWRFPVSALYHVSGSGPLAAAGRLLSYLSYSPALAAIPILLLVLDRLRGRGERGLAVVAVGLCAAGPLFVDQSNLDAKPENAIAAVGIAIAVALTFRAMRTPGRSARGGFDRGDWLRLGLGLAMLAMAVPVLAAELGFSLDGVPVLGGLFETATLRHDPGKVALHPAVHLGHHEGLDGFLLAWSALLLWRCLPAFSSRRLRGLFRGVLCLLLCYGFAVGFGDFWLEQIAKRGWTSWTVDILYPALTASWAILLGAAVVLWAVTRRPWHGGGRLRLGLLLLSVLVLGAAWPGSAASAGSTDIKAVVVSRDSASILTFVIQFAGPVSLDNATKLQVMLDTDRKSSTGIQGAEYALDYSAYRGSEPEPSLIHSIDGKGYTSPTPPRFWTGPSDATFEVPTSNIGDPRVFDFWVFVERNGDLVETAPTHVLVSTYSQPWTYPKDGASAPGAGYPTQTYEDISDTSLETTNIPWKWILLGIVGLAALLGFGGWTFERIRGRRGGTSPVAPPPVAPKGNGSAPAVARRHPGPPAHELEEQLVRARALAAEHHPAGALRLAERVQARAVATRDLPALEGAWDLAAGVYRDSHGKPQQRAGRLAFACQQSVRAVSGNREVVGGAPSSGPLRPAWPASEPSGPPQFPLGLLDGHDLARSLICSFGFCAFLAVLGPLGAHTTEEVVAWAAVWGASGSCSSRRSSCGGRSGASRSGGPSTRPRCCSACSRRSSAFRR